jgi:hypothetical protein
MSRNIVISDRQRINVWVLSNQIRDMLKVKEITGKSKTDIIAEALALYFALMRKEGVL